MAESPDLKFGLSLDTGGPTLTDERTSSLSVEDFNELPWTPGSVTPSPGGGFITPNGTPKSLKVLTPRTSLTPQMKSIMSEMDLHTVDGQEALGKHQRHCLELAKESSKCLSDARGRGRGRGEPNCACGFLVDNYMMCRRNSTFEGVRRGNP